MTERRQAYRMRAEPGFDQIMLQIRGQDVLGRLGDTSALGLNVVCDAGVSIEPGEPLKIRMECGWFAATAKWSETAGNQTVIGLERGDEIPNPKAVWINESRLAPFAFAGIVIAVPLLIETWKYCRPKAPAAARSIAPAQLIEPTVSRSE